MATVQEINFRNTTAFASGDSADAYVQNAAAGSNNYPTTTSQGVRVGWSTSLSIEHRNVTSTLDIRLVGLATSNTGGGIGKYRINLADLGGAGTYRIRLAMGDDDNTRANQKCEIYDDVTSKGVVIATGSSNHFWRDAVDAEYNNANWPGSNTAIDVTFTSTIAEFWFGDGTNNWAVAHIRIEFISGGGSSSPVARIAQLNQSVKRAASF